MNWGQFSAKETTSLIYMMYNTVPVTLLLFCCCLGETGLGKSTLMDTLFNTKFEGDPTQHNQPGVTLKSNTYELQESNVRLKLTVVNTVGFGDQINKEDR